MGERCLLTALARYFPAAGTGVSDDADSVVLVVESDQRLLALTVDKIVSRQHVVVKPLSEQLSQVPGFSGITVLNNGEPALILSLAEVGRSYFGAPHE